MAGELNFKKAWLKKGNHKIEIERIGNKFIVWEYGKDLLKENLELNENEIIEFVEGWKKEGYRFLIEK